MYIRKIYRLPDRNEIEIGFAGRYGKKGEKRVKRKKLTPEQMRRQNQINKTNKLRREMIANFCEGDHFCTLKYPAGTRKPLKEIQKDLTNFKNCMRRAYRKLNAEFKWILRIEIGAQGGIHIHMLINRVKGADSDSIIQSKWKHGRVNFQNCYEAGGFKELANYMVKVEDESYEQLNLFSKKEQKMLTSISTSKNLVRPEPEVKTYMKYTVEKLIKEGPKAADGYYIDKDSVVTGFNEYTGLSYIHYTEIKTGGRKDVHKRLRI